MAAQTTPTIGLIADDLTGATDTAVQFARRGWHTLLTLDVGRQLPPAPFVLAVTTDARSVDNETARSRTADALTKLADAGVDRVYLKIDSTMRGSVPGQISGALAVWRERFPRAAAVVCPAYPKMGRTVVGNKLLVDGRPVEQSAIGRDPATPVTTSDLAVLIPRSKYVRLEELSENAHDIVTVDARSDVDLDNLGAAIDAAGASTIPVGSAGLAGAMASVWSRALPHGKAPSMIESSGPFVDLRVTPKQAPRVLIQVTSINPVSHAQVEKLIEMFPEVVGLVAPRERVADVPVADNIAEKFADRVRSEKWDLLGLVGGDGARAALRLLGAAAIKIVDTLGEGIPFGTIVAGEADGVPVFTKAGGFGAEDALLRAVGRIRL